MAWPGRMRRSARRCRRATTPRRSSMRKLGRLLSLGVMLVAGLGHTAAAETGSGVEYLYVESNEGGSSGGHVALRVGDVAAARATLIGLDRKSTRLNSSHRTISYAVFCLKKKKTNAHRDALCAAESYF